MSYFHNTYIVIILYYFYLNVMESKYHMRPIVITYYLLIQMAMVIWQTSTRHTSIFIPNRLFIWFNYLLNYLKNTSMLNLLMTLVKYNMTYIQKYILWILALLFKYLMHYSFIKIMILIILYYISQINIDLIFFVNLKILIIFYYLI